MRPKLEQTDQTSCKTFRHRDNQPNDTIEQIYAGNDAARKIISNSAIKYQLHGSDKH